jgi:hypothetical protein
MYFLNFNPLSYELLYETFDAKLSQPYEYVNTSIKIQ